jgi:sugar lactone lactonase YvrE
LAGVLLVFASTTSALGAEGPALEFDPVLSLTGDCSVSTADSVPDPGCPGGSHPESHFSRPTSVTTDSHGNIFVASQGQTSGEARVDIFDPEGLFIAEKAIEAGVSNIAVDSDGNVYVIDSLGELLRYSPTKYEPATGEIEYGNPPVAVGP